MPVKINLLLTVGVCWLLLGGAVKALAAPEGRNPFAFPPGIQKGALETKPGTKNAAAGSAMEGQPVTPSFRVTTILISGQTRVAAINGILWRIGDSLEGYRIEAIEDHRVVLGRGKEKMVLHIDSGDRYSFKKKNQDNRVMGSTK